MAEVGVAEFSYLRQRVGKVHRPKRPIKPGPRRNRSQYRVRCGEIIRAGLPVEQAPSKDWCRHCWPGVRD